MTTILVIPHVILQYALCASYFIPSSIQLWNQKPENIKSSRSLQIIKSNLQHQTNTKAIYYYIGTRLGQILHASLRMQCSSLNLHLFRKNMVNSHSVNVRQTKPRPIFCYIVPVTIQQDLDIFTPLIYQLT